MEPAAPEMVGFSIDRLERIRPAMQRYIDQKRVAGIVTLVARRGHIVHFEKFGLQDLETGRPMALDTIFRIYSMTKPVTSVALMMLHEQGLFQLTDPIANFLPGFKRVKVQAPDGQLTDLSCPITFRHILTHTAGLSYGSDSDAPVDKLYRQACLFRPDITLQEMVRRIAELPLVHQPGQKWHYSVATDVAGHLVEVISGMALADFFTQEILQPLGMTDTAYILPSEKLARLAGIYEETRDGQTISLKAIPGTNHTPSLKLCAGGHGLASTAVDYLRFCQMLLNHGQLDGVRLLGRKTVEWMTTNHLAHSLLPIEYNGVVDQSLLGFGFGLGFRVMLDPGQAGIMGTVGDYGWAGLATTVFWIDPQEALIGIFMTQCQSDTGPHPARNEFRNLLYQALVD